MEKRITDGAAQNRAEAELLEARGQYEQLANKVRMLRAHLTAAEEELDEADAVRRRAKRELLDVEEEQAAAAFLDKLDPISCPRCSTKITEARRLLEKAEGKCSVCATQVESPDPLEAAAFLNEARERLDATEKLEIRARKGRDRIETLLNDTRGELKRAGERLSALSTRGTAADAQMLEIEKAKLEGVLETIERILNSDEIDDAHVTVLNAAEDEATERVNAAASSILKRASEEVTRLALSLGMTDVEEISIKRNANVHVRKGGSISSFGDLSPGERLRVRIATVVALIKSAHEHGAGRHPGLLMIDSPTAEEMADANVEAMLDALAKLPEAVPNLQMFVACRGTARAKAAFPRKRLLDAGVGDKLW